MLAEVRGTPVSAWVRMAPSHVAVGTACQPRCVVWPGLRAALSQSPARSLSRPLLSSAALGFLSQGTAPPYACVTAEPMKHNVRAGRLVLFPPSAI